MFSGACVCCGASMYVDGRIYGGILCMVGHVLLMGSSVNKDTVYVL